MMEQKVEYSIIVPVYNAENTIERCIKSVLEQTFSNFELLLIDDGSKDRSASICRFYADKDFRISYIREENRGVSSARNLGLEHAAGKYILFLDSDDYLEIKALELFKACGDGDLVITSLIIKSENGEIEHIWENERESYELNKSGNITKYYNSWYAISVLGKRFKREIIERKHLRFDESLNYGEDSLFNICYAISVSGFVHIEPVRTYVYCKSHNESLSKLGDKWIEKYILALEKQYCSVDNDEVKNCILLKYCWFAENKLSEICGKHTRMKPKIRDIKLIINSLLIDEAIKGNVCDFFPKIIKFAIQKKWASLIFTFYAIIAVRKKLLS